MRSNCSENFSSLSLIACETFEKGSRISSIILHMKNA